MKINYKMDKETKGTYRFTPEDPTVIGVVPIYLPKTVIRQLEINPVKGLRMTLEPQE